MESRLHARIAALTQAEPVLADDLALRGALIEIVDLAEIGPVEPRLPAGLARARLAAGVPLLDRLDLPIAAPAAALLDRLTVAFLTDAGMRQEAEALLRALREHRLHAEQLIGEAVVGHDDHLTALAESADVSERLVVTVADLAARALLAPIAVRLRPALSLGTWSQNYCPICGGLPLLAEAAEAPPPPLRGANIDCVDVPPHHDGEGSKMRPVSPSPSQWGGGRGVGVSLRCGRCASAWAHTLQRCPDCTDGSFGVIETEDDLDLAGWQIAACNACPEYVKIAPSPRSHALADLLIDDLETWRLDRRALQQGRQRRGGVGYRLEHGEPAGEELDDD